MAQQLEEELKKLQEDAIKDIQEIKNKEDFDRIDLKYFGRKEGLLTTVLKSLKDLPADQKPLAGKLSNEIKINIEAKLNEKKNELEKIEIEKELSKEFFDTTIPGKAPALGTIHPLAQVQEEVERIFSQMGFSIMDGPEVESEYYCFEALNIPKHHPARDMQDTFFVANKNHEKHGELVMRTHTSPGQIRTMEKYGAPLRIIIPGRVFRNESIDPRHEYTFNQVEGLLIDKNISMAHLKGTFTNLLSRLFQKEVEIRLRPGYFPFVEPGLEIDFSCLLCEKKGCRVCKYTGWVEFTGAGMVHANVLKAGGIDPNIYQGWAFGFGLERLAMMRHGITEIRLFNQSDLRFLKQF